MANQVRSPWAVKKLIKGVQQTLCFKNRLRVEACILRQLNHPNIVGFRSYFKTPDDENCLAMEEGGKSLGTLIEERSDEDLLAFPSKDIMKVAMDIAEGLNYLHTEAYILHSDIKSYNVLIKGDFEICKLCDFGVSLPLNDNGTVNEDKAGPQPEYIGTRLWCAPEVFNYPPNITSKADIFSYGLTLWEMLALRPPFADEVEESINSEDSFEESIKQCKIGTRPELPPQEFADSYRYVLEIFHCCTEEDHLKRPSALDLTISIPQMIESDSMEC